MKTLCLVPGLILLLLLSGTVSSLADETSSEQLHSLFEDAWQFSLAEDPLFATRVGENRTNDQLPQVSVADNVRRLAAERDYHKRWQAIDRQKLSRKDQISYDIFGRLKQDRIAEYEFKSTLMPITNRSGFHIEFPELPRKVPLNTVKDYENYVARLAEFKRYAQQHIELMRAGIKAEMVLPSIVLRGFERSIRAHLVKQPAESLLFAPLKKFPDRITPEDRQRLTEAAKQAITQSVVPGYENFLTFMIDEYMPAARGHISASTLPNGRAWYRHRVRRFTTLDLTPQEIHDTGLAEVQRIQAEMHTVIQQTEFKGDFKAFLKHLRTDSKFYADTPEQLMKEVAYVLKQMDGRLPALFGVLPRMPYGIRKVPAYIAPQTTTAYYMEPAGDGSRAGFYYVNTYNLKSRPLYEIEALSLHEGVPGHHLQIALQQELEGLPKFQRFAGFTAFIEGWGLYAERLGLEAGFYTDPYRNFGRLSYEMWRACRLVVDTGMHYFGWTRQQAIEFMAEHTALTLLNITNEVDRYISWPGQALAYKTGELKIRALRAHAQESLGDRFDVRQFHDVVLGSGAVPLNVLEENVERYLLETCD